MEQNSGIYWKVITLKKKKNSEYCEPQNRVEYQNV